ncbi:golvesin C-terminal-like domain-containing protein, partial [Sanguibacteroides justesenii]|uniref:golvesin C-terminal-like domain-containing protein n=1 Tax=Sanguibacteroides justesenii TaxID=1547597 RepID=UPI003F693BE1
RRFPRMGWYEPRNPYLHFSEVPVSFRLSSGVGKPLAGLTEPGIVFFRERGFEYRMLDVVTGEKVKTGDEFFAVFNPLYQSLFNGNCPVDNSHPLRGIGYEVKGPYYTGSQVKSLDDDKNVWVHSLKYPFMGKIFEIFQNNMHIFARPTDIFFLPEIKSIYDYLSNHTLQDMLLDPGLETRMGIWVFLIKVRDLWNSLTMYIPPIEFQACLDSLYSYRHGEIDYDSLVGLWGTRWGVDVDNILQRWVMARHDQCFRIKDDILYYDTVAKRMKVMGNIMNIGKTGGMVFIEHKPLPDQKVVERFSCYLEPGETRAFTLVSGSVISMNTGLSANRPCVRYFSRYVKKEGEDFGEFGGEWRSISVEEFLAGENKNEFVVDDQDAGFELVDGNLTLFQKWFRKEPPLRGFQKGETSRWVQVITDKAYGDLIQGCYCISGGDGKSTATWRVNLSEAGRYRVMAKVYKQFLVPGFGYPEGVIYHYTIFHGDKKEEVAVALDEILPGRYESSGWVSLGEYDFPAGEAKVVLSDKDPRRRKDVAIVADAVKWIKIE